MVDLLSSRFRCAWKRVGTFTAIRRDGRNVDKRGGNVASYFLTPAGRVLGAVLGAAEPELFLDEAAWALEAARHPTSDALRAAHLSRVEHLFKHPAKYRVGGRCGDLNPLSGVTVHKKLAEGPAPLLSSVERHFFEKVLGQVMSEGPILVLEK